MRRKSDCVWITFSITHRSIIVTVWSIITTNMSRISPQGSKESMYVVWSDGKPVTVLKAHRGAYWGSRTTTPNRPRTSGTPLPGIGPNSVPRSSSGGSGGSNPPNHVNSSNMRVMPSSEMPNQHLPLQVRQAVPSGNMSPSLAPPRQSVPSQQQVAPQQRLQDNGHARWVCGNKSCVCFHLHVQ